MRNFLSRVLFAVAAFAVIAIFLFSAPHASLAALAFIPFVSKRVRKTAAKLKGNKMKNLEPQWISLVEVPATDKPAIVKSFGGHGFQINANIVKYDEKQGIAYGIAYPVDEVDLQGDYIEADELQKAAHNFLLKSNNGNVDVEHNLQKGAGGVVESSILDAPDARYPDSKAGDWAVAIKLSDEFKKSGKTFKGFSIYGTCQYAQKDAAGTTGTETSGDPDGDGLLLQRLRVAAQVADTDMAEALDVDHNDYMAIENGQKEYDWDDATIAAAAKKLKVPPALFATLMNYDGKSETPAEGDNPAQGENAGTLPQTSIDNGANSGKSVTFNQQNMNPKEKAKRKSAIDSEKVFLSKGVYDIPVTVDDNGRLFARPADHEAKKAHNIKLAKKALVSMALVGDERREFLSKADIASTDFGFFDAGNVLNPELANSLISIVVDQTPFLKKTQTKVVSRRDAEIDVIDVNPRTAIRITPGSPAGTSAGQSAVNRSFQVHTAPMHLSVKLDKRTIRENSNLAGLEETVFNNFIAGFKNDILDLGCNGIANDFAGAAWNKLKTGWLTLMNTAPATGGPGVPVAQNISVAGAGLDIADMETVFKTMKNAGTLTNPRFSWDEMPFIIGTVDSQTYRNQLKDRPDGLVSLVVTEGNVAKWDGNPIEKVNYLTTKNGMLTPYQNLGVAILGGGGAPGDGIIMERHDVELAIQLIMEVQLDYFIVNPLSAVLLRA